MVEVDVVLSYSLIGYDIFYFWEKNEKYENVLRIYKFDKNILKVLFDDDLKNYMVVKLKIINNRRDKELSLLFLILYEDLCDWFLNFYIVGCDIFMNDVYLIFFFSLLDSVMSEDFVLENFEFLFNLKLIVIFDFYLSLKKKCLYYFVDVELERVV